MTGRPDPVLLAILSLAGGFGLGVQFNALIAHLIAAVPGDYAPDISGVSTTTLQIGGAIGVAAFGTVYLGFASHVGVAQATDAFVITALALAGTALIAAASAYLATHVGSTVDGDAE